MKAALFALGRNLRAVGATALFLIGMLIGVVTIWIGLGVLKLGMLPTGVGVNVLVTVRDMLHDLRSKCDTALDDE